MAPRKQKKAATPGLLEQQLKAAEQASKVTQRKATEQLKLSPELPPFFARNEAHPYGTCWKCGDPRQHAGGLPGGSDAYFCPRCNEWLPIRESPKDPAKVSIIEDKKSKKTRD